MTDPGLMASAAFDFYDGIFGTGFSRTRRFDLSRLGLPQLQLHSLETLFSEDEVWAVIRDLPCDKAPGPDGLTGAFYKKAWPIIKGDLLNAFNAFWAQDARSFHLLNDAYLVLVAKKEQPEGIGDYRPISLIHSFGKLITKCLANRLAPVLGRLVLPNQSAFIKGRCLYDNVRDVQLACRAIQKEKLPVSCSRYISLRHSTPCLGLFCWRCSSISASDASGGIGSPSFFPRQARGFCSMDSQERGSVMHAGSDRVTRSHRCCS